MIRVPVVSSHLSAVGYDPTTQTLEVAFKKGGVYQYLSVPSSVHASLMTAPSVGRYFDVYIKRAGYIARKISL
ncbi:KTSC domain-containing protein [Frigoribacterium sp. PvP032]|uniref:KTSC domain-containing protein n=1 Tax=Frigoribacterium sp. PvP032 TaxID=2806589 RepID=UPI001AEA0B79|nr:hypothetical protein [Frigoribacterium sp. PvP032]